MPHSLEHMVIVQLVRLYVIYYLPNFKDNIACSCSYTEGERRGRGQAEVKQVTNWL